MNLLSVAPPPPSCYIVLFLLAAMEVSDQYHRVLLHVEDYRQICAAGEEIIAGFLRVQKSLAKKQVI